MFIHFNGKSGGPHATERRLEGPSGIESSYMAEGTGNPTKRQI
jgi:hypothetical protein